MENQVNGERELEIHTENQRDKLIEHLLVSNNEISEQIQSLSKFTVNIIERLSKKP
jgi:hypothetical protein